MASTYLRIGAKPSRTARALVLTALAVVTMAPFATLGEAQAQVNLGGCAVDPDRIVRYADGWEEIPAPAFVAGIQEIRAYAAHPYDPDVLFVTNGSHVMRSTDGGCSFDTVFDLASDGGPVRSLSTIVAIEIPMAPSASDRVYVLVQGPQGVGAQVFVSNDSGTSWAPSSAGLVGAGTPLELVIAETSPQNLYLLASVSSAANAVAEGGVRSLVYRSRDGGSSWELASEPGTALGEISKQRPGIALVDVALDPLDGQILWGASGSGLYRSRDGGATWELVAEVALPVGVVEVIHGRGQQAHIFAFASGSLSVFHSDDGGATWNEELTRPGPEGVDSGTHHPTSGNLIISLDSTEAQVYRLNPAGTWDLLSWFLHPGFRALSFDRAAQSTLYAYSRFALWRSSTTSPPRAAETRQPPQSAPSQFRVREGCLPSQPLPSGFSSADQVASLIPDGKRIVMSVGESREVPYTLDISAAPVPFDVYFLIDTSDSMLDTICALGLGLRQLVADLSLTIPDIYFGVAEYNDWSSIGLDSGTGVNLASCYTPYERHRQIGPPDSELADAFARIARTCGGEEPGTLALQQSVTGTGNLVHRVPAGQDARFRANAAKVIVHATDEHIQTAPTTPAIDGAIEALNTENVSQVGLTGAQQATNDLRRVASGTGAVAPEGGVDCDSDGVIDLVAGEPVVCAMWKSGVRPTEAIADVVVEMIKAIADKRPVQLDATEGNDVIEAIDPAVYPAVDMLDPHVLPFTVTYHCDAADAGQTFPVELTARSDELALASARATVMCVAPRNLFVPPTAALAVPPAPPQVARIPQPNPNPNPNPNPQPRLETQAQQQLQQQAQAQAQGVAVPQRQQQQQMAFVTAAQQVKEQAGEHAMVARSSRRDPLGATKAGFIAGALSLTLAYGITTLSLQRRVRVARRR